MTGLSETADRWLAGRRRRDEVRPATWKANRTHLRSLAEHLGADRPLTEVTIDDIEGWLDELADRGLKPSSRNIYLASVRTFFTWAAAHRLVGASPVAGVARAKVPKRQPRRVQGPVVARILQVADFRARVMITLALGLGLRRSEIAGLQVEDWDRTARTITVRGKGDKERTLPIEGPVAVALELWVGGRVAGPMWPSQKGGGLSSGRVAMIITETSGQLGIKITPHQYRHTFASEAVMAHTPLSVVQAYLGHESIATTGIYVTASAEELRDELRRGEDWAEWTAPLTEAARPVITVESAPGGDFT